MEIALFILSVKATWDPKTNEEK